MCSADGPRLIEIPLTSDNAPLAPPGTPRDEAMGCAHAIRARAPMLEDLED